MILFLIVFHRLKNLTNCHYWYFLDKGLKFQSTVCNSCHDVFMISIDIDNIGILNICGVDY